MFGNWTFHSHHLFPGRIIENTGRVALRFELLHRLSVASDYRIVKFSFSTKIDIRRSFCPSTAMPRTTKSFRDLLNASSSGISARHGAHHVAHIDSRAPAYREDSPSMRLLFRISERELGCRSYHRKSSNRNHEGESEHPDVGRRAGSVRREASISLPKILRCIVDQTPPSGAT